MSKNPDIYNANKMVGRSHDAPGFIEDPQQRHAARKARANSLVKRATGECELRGWSLKIGNYGHHWRMYSGREMIAEWWPSSAKLVLRRKYEDGIHAHGWDQVIKILDINIPPTKTLFDNRT